MRNLKVLFVSIFIAVVGLFLVSCGSSHEHTLEHHAQVDATCTTNGTMTYYECSSCHKMFSDATCNEQVYAEDLVINAAGHKPGAEATCTTNQVCQVCNVEVAPAKGHTPGAEADCTNPQNCTVCNAELAPAKGHTPGADADCTTAQTCTVCNAELAPAEGHTPGAEATCTTDQVCTVCSTVVTPALGHNPGADATCGTDQTCTVCGAVVTPATGHILVHHEAVAPTVGQAGSMEYYECSSCHAYFSDAEGTNEIVDKNVTVYAYLITKDDANTAGYRVDYRESHTFVDANNTGEFVSNNQGISSSGAYMDIFFTASGTITFSYVVSSESGWDKFNIYGAVNGNSYTSLQLGISGEQSGTLTYTVNAGDYIYFQYNKDSGGNKGSDCAKVYDITFVTTEHYLKHTLTFNTNGGSEVAPISAYSGVAITAPESVKEGFFFDGWYTDAELTNAFDAANGLSADVTVYAKWVAGVTVTYANTANTVVDAMFVKPNTAITAPTVVPTSDTQYFNGWYADAECTVAFDFASGVSVDTVVYAGWRNPVVVSFSSEGDVVVDNIYTDINVAITLPADPVRAGYRFDGWYADAEFNTVFDAEAGVVENTTVYVKWVEQVVISYVHNGVVVGTDSIDINNQYIAATPADFNETVTGWYTDEALTTLFVDGSVVAASMSLYAKVHSIAPDGVLSSFVNGGSNSEWVYNAQTDSFTSSNKGMSNSSSVMTFTFAKESFVSFSFVVNSESNYDCLIISVNGSQVYSSKVSGMNGKDVIGSYSNTFASGDVFEIRYKKDSSGNQGSDCAIINGLVINDGIPSVSVTFDYQDSAVENAVVPVEINSAIGSIENFDSYAPADTDDRHFGGWYYDADCTIAANANDPVLKNVTLYAKYIFPATITFDTDGAGEIEAINVWTGVSIVDAMPANPSKAGYIFRYWLNENAEEFDPALGVSGDMLLTAYFDELPVGSTIEEAMVVTMTDGEFNSGTVTTNEEFQNFYLVFTPEVSDYYYFAFNSDYASVVGGTVNNKNYRRYAVTDMDGNSIISETSSDSKAMLEAGVQYLIRYNLAYGSNKAWGSFVVEIASYPHDNAATEAIPYAFGDSVVIPAGTYHTNKENIVYAYTAQATGTYALSIGSTAWASVGVYTNADLANSNRVVYKTVSNSSAVVDFEAVEGTTYYIVLAHNWSGSGLLTNVITFNVNNYPQGYSPQNPYNYTLGEVMDVVFTSGSNVYYTVEITESGTYSLNLLSLSDSNKKIIEIYSADDLTTPINSVAGTAATNVYLEDLAVGTYVIKCFNESTSYTTSFTASLTQVADGGWWTTAVQSSLNASNTLNASANGYYYTVTTSTETLWYFITATNGTVAVYDAERTLIGSTAIQLQANTMYYVVVTGEAETVAVEISTLVEYADGKSPAGAFTYTEGGVVLSTSQANHTTYVKVTVAESGNYRIYTYNNGAIDTKAWIYSDETCSTQLGYNDDGGQSKVDAGITGYKWDCCFETTLEAGVTYYIKVTYTVGSSTNIGDGLTLHIVNA